MNIVIVAGGLGSRLSPLTDFVPKFLVNIGKNTGYVEMINYWRKQSPNPLNINFTVIVHGNYENLVREYHNLYFPKVNLTIKTINEASGSAHAILSTCDHLEGQSVLFSWCDVIPDVPIAIDEMEQQFDRFNVIFTNYNNSNRYGVKRVNASWNNVVPYLDADERGGCFGVYYVYKYHSKVKYDHGQDFIDVITQYGNIQECRLEKIIDFGDMPKLIRTRAKADEGREFNSIEFNGDLVIKKSLNNQGDAIIRKEIDWYRQVAPLNNTGEGLSIPETWIGTDNRSLIMSKVKGIPVWKAWDKLSSVDRHFVVSQMIEQRRRLFYQTKVSMNYDDIQNDIIAETSGKLIARYQEIEGVIKSFGKIRTINGHTLDEVDPIVTIKRLANLMSEYYKENPQPYGIIHGDLQMSNSMVDLETLKVTIIDPRGKFGNTTCYGLEDYDIAKLMYSLSGYDLFNYSPTFSIQKLDGFSMGRIWFDIPKPDINGLEDITQTFKAIHEAWLAVIWFGLGQYIKNDPVKSLCAHYHGLSRMERACDKIIMIGYNTSADNAL